MVLILILFVLRIGVSCLGYTLLPFARLSDAMARLVVTGVTVYAWADTREWYLSCGLFCLIVCTIGATTYYLVPETDVSSTFGLSASQPVCVCVKLKSALQVICSDMSCI